jgi:hypothetical protein
MIWLQRFAENNKNSKRKIVAKMDKPGKINLSPMGMRLFGQPPSGEVLGLGATQPGSHHDKSCADEEGYTFPEGSILYQDTGFQGYTPEGTTTIQPTKKPRGQELTAQQKAENRKISQERVGVEHSLAGIKIFQIVSTVFRNIKKGFVDLVMEVACGLFNLCRTCRRTV